MATTLTALPSTLAAGTTVTYRRSLTDYPASAGWSLVLYLAGASVANVAGVANGADFDVTIPAATTATLTPGVYTWVERVSKAGEVHDAASGAVTVTPNVATAGAGALQSWEEKTLVVVEAAIAGSLEKGILEYQIHGRAVKKYSATELLKLRSWLKGEIAAKGAGGRGKRVVFGFSNTGYER